MGFLDIVDLMGDNFGEVVVIGAAGAGWSGDVRKRWSRRSMTELCVAGGLCLPASLHLRSQVIGLSGAHFDAEAQRRRGEYWVQGRKREPGQPKGCPTRTD